MKCSGHIRRWFVVAIGVAFVTVTSGCTLVEQFFLVNSSTTPLTVTATATIYNNVNTGDLMCSWAWQARPLRGISAGKVRREHVPFAEMTELGNSTYDEASCSVRVSLDPGTALLLWSTSTGRHSDFLTRIVLGDAGQRVISGADVEKRFDKKSLRAVHVMEYKSSSRP